MNSTDGGWSSSCFQSNPDITGVGVRVTFYVQTSLLVLIANWPPSQAHSRYDPSVLWALISSNLGLTVASITQAAHSELSFLQGLQVSNLVCLANFAAVLALARSPKERAAERKSGISVGPGSGGVPKERAESRKVEESRDGVHKSETYATLFQAIFSTSLTIYLWRDPATFGNQASCSSSVSYIVFGKPLPALGVGRRVALAMSVFLLVLYILLTLVEFRSLSMRKKSKTEPIVDKSTPTSLRRYSILIGTILILLLLFSYFITSNEQLLKRNPDLYNANKAWGFGQIFALVASAPSVISVLRLVKQSLISGFRHDQSSPGPETNTTVDNQVSVSLP